MKRVMLDIETLSTDKHAAVLSVGVAVFDTINGITHTDGWAIRMDKDLTGRIDPQTVSWWMKQEEVVRDFSWKGEHSPMSVLVALRVVLVDTHELWACDPDFDCAILQHWWERTAPAIPWPVSFRKYRSCRTMSMIAKAKGIDTKEAWGTSTAHNPIEDAAGQAREMIVILKALEIE